MYKRLTIAVVFFWPVLACAADWQDVADTSLGQMKLDTASVTREGKLTKAVLVYEFKVEQRFYSPPKDAFNKREDTVLVDCSHPSLGLESSRFFDKEKLVNTFTEKFANIKLNPAAPDTMAKTVVDAVCAVKSKAKP